jgi:hypothetical protein
MMTLTIAFLSSSSSCFFLNRPTIVVLKSGLVQQIDLGLESSRVDKKIGKVMTRPTWRIDPVKNPVATR